MRKLKKTELPKPECPACYSLIPINYKKVKPTYKQIRFWRVHHYDETYYKLNGVLCKCGYLISDSNYRDYLASL